LCQETAKLFFTSQWLVKTLLWVLIKLLAVFSYTRIIPGHQGTAKEKMTQLHPKGKELLEQLRDQLRIKQ